MEPGISPGSPTSARIAPGTASLVHQQIEHDQTRGMGFC